MIQSLDHLVLSVKSINASVDFYCNVLGITKGVFGKDRVALTFGDQKTDLHQGGKEIEPKASSPTPGSADLCFIPDPIEQAYNEVGDKGVEILEYYEGWAGMAREQVGRIVMKLPVLSKAFDVKNDMLISTRHDYGMGNSSICKLSGNGVTSPLDKLQK